jgi:hypothetical protein
MIHENVVQKYSSYLHRFHFTQRGSRHLFARVTRAGASAIGAELASFCQGGGAAGAAKPRPYPATQWEACEASQTDRVPFSSRYFEKGKGAGEACRGGSGVDEGWGRKRRPGVRGMSGCRGGSGVDEGRGRKRRPGVRGMSSQEQDAGDASVSTLLNPAPAPTERQRFSVRVPKKPTSRVRAGLVPALVNALMTYALVCMLALLITSCNWPGAQQTAQSDARLQSFHVLSARIIMLDTQAEVDGTLQNTSRTDRFPYDVTVIATFYNRSGNVVGQAGGVAEDVYPGMSRPFILVGQVDSTQYSHMVVTVISLKERRIEKIIPTPSVVP